MRVAWGEGRASPLLRRANAPSSRPSDTSSRRPGEAAEAACSVTREPAAHRRASTRRSRASPRCLPPGETPRALSRAPAWSATLTGRRGGPPHGFIDVRRHRLDLSTRTFSRVGERPRALLRLLQVSVSTSTTVDRSSTPTAESAGGATALEDRVSPVEGNHRTGSRSGAEETVPRRSPRRLLVAETSPQPRPLRAPPVAVIALLPCPE